MNSNNGRWKSNSRASPPSPEPPTSPHEVHLLQLVKTTTSHCSLSTRAPQCLPSVLSPAISTLTLHSPYLAPQPTHLNPSRPRYSIPAPSPPTQSTLPKPAPHTSHTARTSRTTIPHPAGYGGSRPARGIKRRGGRIRGFMGTGGVCCWGWCSMFTSLILREFLSSFAVNGFPRYLAKRRREIGVWGFVGFVVFIGKMRQLGIHHFG